MKFKNFPIIFLLIFTFCILFLPFAINLQEKTVETPYHIAFIRLKEGGQFWSTMRNGARTARTETGCIVDFYSGVMASDVSSQYAFVEEAIKKKVDCIVITPCNTLLMEKPLKKASDAGIKVIQLFNETTDNKTFSKQYFHRYMTDTKVVGSSLAKSLITENPAQQQSVLIVGSSEFISSEKQMEEGIRETFQKYPSLSTHSIYVGYESMDITEQVETYLQNNIDTNMIIALNNDTSEAIINIFKQKGKPDNLVFIASTHSLTNIENLETGIIDNLLVVNSFAMGYQAIYSAIKLLKGEPVLNAPIDYAIVTKENMFSPTMQRKLFPLI